MGLRTVAILASALMQGALLAGAAEAGDANRTDTGAASPSAYSARQQLRGSNASLTGVPLLCPVGCTYYFFGCGTLGNPPPCDLPYQSTCCKKG